MKCLITLTLCIISIFLFFSSSVLAVELELQQKLTASDASSNNFFGYSVSISGEYAIVGAYRDDDRGSAYIFHREGSTWIQQQKLRAPSPASGDWFAYSVSISGDYAIVGDMYHDNNGVAYIFHRNGLTWELQQTLTTSYQKEVRANFGISVSLSGNYAIVGACRANEEHSLSGAAFVFYREGSTWIQQQILSTSDPESTAFGHSVDISENYAIVGSGSFTFDSACYIFLRNGSTWTQQQKLTPSSSINFGKSLSISGNYVIVGANEDDEGALNSGCAYILHRDGSTWKVHQTLKPSEPLRYLTFGSSVNISGDYAIVGTDWGSNQVFAPEGDTKDAAYVFYRDGSTWILQQKLTAPDSKTYDYFAHSVSISEAGDEVYAIAGAYGDDDDGSLSGSAYVFSPTVDPGNDDSDDEEPDSLPDSETIHTKEGNKDVTLGSATSNTKLKNIKAVSRDSSDIPSSLETPYGLFSFTITELACEGATVKMVLYVDYDASIIGYYKKMYVPANGKISPQTLKKSLSIMTPKQKSLFI